MLNSRRHKKHVRQFRWNTLLSRDFLTNSDGEMPWPQPLHLVPYRLVINRKELKKNCFYCLMQWNEYTKEMFSKCKTWVKSTLAHLKKSFLQYNFASRLKHFSVSSCKQSQHRTHDVCHRRSDTFNKNLSRIGSLQPAHGSPPTPTDGSARPKRFFEIS